MNELLIIDLPDLDTSIKVEITHYRSSINYKVFNKNNDYLLSITKYKMPIDEELDFNENMIISNELTNAIFNVIEALHNEPK